MEARLRKGAKKYLLDVGRVLERKGGSGGEVGVSLWSHRGDEKGASCAVLGKRERKF